MRSGWCGRSSSRRTREHWLCLVLALAALPALAALGHALDPDPRGLGTHEQLGLRACLGPEVLGIPCPACGVTTAVVHALHGHPVRAFVTQPLGLAIALGVPLAAGWVLWTHARGGDVWATLMGGRADRWVRLALVVAALAWGWKIVAARGQSPSESPSPTASSSEGSYAASGSSSSSIST